MKKFLFFISTAVLLGITSCSDDSCDHIIPTSPPPISPIIGSWYEETENEEMRFGENGTFYDKYCNTRRSAEVEGRWEYDYANKKLTYTYSFLGQTQFADWTVKNIKEDNLGFTISSTKVADHNLEKIVETYKMEVGAVKEIQFAKEYPAYSVQSYVSNNPRLASVTNDGKITAEGEKGTTYIKVVTDKLTVWVKVVVGDDCLDLWYNYPSLMGASYNELKDILGIPSIKGDDGYSYGYILADLNDYVQEVDVFLNLNTGLVEEIGMCLKPSVPESEILTYLKSHYYGYEEIGPEYYTTAPDIEKSVSVVQYDKENAVVHFLPSEVYQWPDYTYSFGLTTDEIVKEFGSLYYDILPYYFLTNYYVESVYFNMDDVTDKVTAYQLTIRPGIDVQSLHKLLSSKYNHYKSNEANTQFAYRDGDSQETSKVMIVYNSEKGVVIYYDLENYGKSSNNVKKRALEDNPFSFDIDTSRVKK